MYLHFEVFFLERMSVIYTVVLKVSISVHKFTINWTNISSVEMTYQVEMAKQLAKMR